MEFRIAKSEFLKGLRLAQSIAERKSTMPMLSNALLRATGSGQLLVAATDLNVSVSAELASENLADGGITVNAKSLHDIVASLPSEEVSLKKAENNWAEISSGKVNYRLVGMPDRDFPKIPDHREVEFVEVDADVVRDMIDKTLFSVSSDETRFHLNGVLFESDGTLARMVSTDGHRLSKVERPLPGGPKLSAGVIIPKKGVLEIKRALDGASGACQIAVMTPYVFVTARSVSLAVKLIDAQFPPYEQVVPTGNDNIVEIDRAQLVESLKRAQLMSSDTRGVKVAVSAGALQITGDNPELGEVKEELAVVYQGEPISVGFNPRYVIDLLSHIANPEISLELAGELDPVLIRPKGDASYLGVVMPMRI
jgi:DNA polymerase-3 subunit beta